MRDPRVVGTKEDTHQVTAIISHFIRSGREQRDEQVEQLMDAEMARSLTAFRQLLDTIEHKRIR
jgi:hypothetical protein